MSKSPLNDEIGRLTSRLRPLGNRAVALHSAAVAERIFDIYPACVAKEGKGNLELVRNALDSVWKALQGDDASARQLTSWLPLLEDAVPHADDCESLACLLAGTPCACIESAIRYCVGDESVPPALAAALDGLRALQSDHQTGYIELGSGPDADAFEATLLEAQIVRMELGRQEADLEEIRAAGRIAPALVEAIRQRAVAQRMVFDEYLR